MRETAERTAQPFHLHVAEHCGSAIALCEGRLADAEAMAERSHEWSRLLTGRDASGVYGIQMFGVRREQGRLAELAPVIRLLAAEATPWRPGLASLLAELGMEDEARRELARVVADGLDVLPRLALARLADVPHRRVRGARRRGDGRAAVPRARAARGHNVMIGHVVACYGAADRHARHARRHARASGSAPSAHFERAMALNRRDGRADVARPHRLRVRAHAAARGARATAPAALLGEAERLAERIGMPALLDRIRGARRLDGRGGPPDGLSFREVQILGLVAQGLSNREIGSHAVHQRAHGRQPHPQHPAQDPLREPDRGRLLRAPPRPGRGVAARYDRRHAAVRDRARRSPRTSSSRATTSG